MMLVEQTSVPSAALPVLEFKDHLRLGSGFADDAVQDSVLETCLRAAISAIEARTAKVLFQRSFLWTLTAWRDLGRQVLPVAPVSMITGLSIVDRVGTDTVADTGSYHLAVDTHRPALVANGICLPGIPVGGAADIHFDAGFGTGWSDIPADLAQAVMLLAAHYYEHRNETGMDDSAMPFGVSGLIERYRNIRLMGGAR